MEEYGTPRNRDKMLDISKNPSEASIYISQITDIYTSTLDDKSLGVFNKLVKKQGLNYLFGDGNDELEGKTICLEGAKKVMARCTYHTSGGYKCETVKRIYALLEGDLEGHSRPARAANASRHLVGQFCNYACHDPEKGLMFRGFLESANMEPVTVKKLSLLQLIFEHINYLDTHKRILKYLE